MKDLHININSIVVVGAWNIAIFTQQWVRENVLRAEDYPQFSVEYPLNVLNSLRFSTDTFSFCIAEGRLVFTLLTNTEEAAKDAIATLRIICQKLPYTPVRALGINFAFEADKNIDINSSLPHTEELVKCVGNIKTTNITRSFAISENETLNFKIVTDEKTVYDFNYDFQVKKITEITDIIADDDNIINSKKEKSLTILESIYQEERE